MTQKQKAISIENYYHSAGLSGDPFKIDTGAVNLLYAKIKREVVLWATLPSPAHVLVEGPREDRDILFKLCFEEVEKIKHPVEIKLDEEKTILSLALKEYEGKGDVFFVTGVEEDAQRVVRDLRHKRDFLYSFKFPVIIGVDSSTVRLIAAQAINYYDIIARIINIHASLDKEDMKTWIISAIEDVATSEDYEVANFITEEAIDLLSNIKSPVRIQQIVRGALAYKVEKGYKIPTPINSSDIEHVIKGEKEMHVSKLDESSKIVFNYVKGHPGVSSSDEEIMDELGLSLPRIKRILDSLVAQGFIRSEEKKGKRVYYPF